MPRVLNSRSRMSSAHGDDDAPCAPGTVPSRSGAFAQRVEKAPTLSPRPAGRWSAPAVLPGPRVRSHRVTALSDSLRSDRMGYRLEGAAIGDLSPAEQLARHADGRCAGSAAGQPILLMADHATAGGYAVAATSSAPIFPAAQLVRATGLSSSPVPCRWPTLRFATRRRRLATSDAAAFQDEMAARFGATRLQAAVTLAPLTTFKVGGPAEWLLETANSQEITDALRIAHRAGVKVTMLGGGSNVLIGDRGLRGLVLRTRGGHIEQPRAGQVRADAPTTINGLVRWTIHRGIAGLETWAGTPGTVGGAIFGNAHFGGRLIGELVESVRLAERDGSTRDLSRDEMEFGYDRSRLQSTGEVLLFAVFRFIPASHPRSEKLPAIPGLP